MTTIPQYACARMLVQAICLVVAGLMAELPVSAQYLTLHDPNGVSGQGTIATGVDGNYVVGADLSGQTQSFYYNISSGKFTDFMLPNSFSTWAHGISGANIVGSDVDSSLVRYGFVYNMNTSAYTLLSDPSEAPGSQTFAEGISGNIVTGYYSDAAGIGATGYYYNIQTGKYTNFALQQPNSYTVPDGIDGNEIVGAYGVSGASEHGFLYDTSTATFTTLDDPEGTYTTELDGIYGNYVVGQWYSSESTGSSFLYNMTNGTFTDFADPLGPTSTFGLGVDGQYVVGDFGNNPFHGFLYNYPGATDTPEPGGITLVSAIIAATLTVLRCRIRRGAVK